MKTYTHAMILIVLTLFAACGGCASRQVARCTAPEDNPKLHYVTGMDLIEKGDFQAAHQRLERTIYCNEAFSAAYDGLAIVAAHIASGDDGPRGQGRQGGAGGRLSEKGFCRGPEQ